jgi:hypothetical protein
LFGARAASGLGERRGAGGRLFESELFGRVALSERQTDRVGRLSWQMAVRFFSMRLPTYPSADKTFAGGDRRVQARRFFETKASVRVLRRPTPICTLKWRMDAFARILSGSHG